MSDVFLATDTIKFQQNTDGRVAPHVFAGRIETTEFQGTFYLNVTFGLDMGEKSTRPTRPAVSLSILHAFTRKGNITQ